MAIFAPGVALLNRFGFARKFQLLFCVFLLPIGYGVITIYEHQIQVIDMAEAELNGYETYEVLHIPCGCSPRSTGARQPNG